MSGGFYGGEDMGALVFDAGHNSFRAGFAGEDLPKCDLPSMIGCIDDYSTKVEMGATNGVDPSANTVNPHHNRKYLFGSQFIHAPTPNLELIPLLDEGMIEKWDLFEKTLQYIYQNHLKVESSHHPVLFSEVPWNTRSNREKLCELVFEKFNVPAFFLCKNAVLAAFANGRATGVVLDSGTKYTVATPVHDGYVFPNTSVKSPLAGDFVTSQCIEYFKNKNVEIVPSTMVASKEAVKEGEPPKWTKRSYIPDNLTESWKDYMIRDTLHDFKMSALQISDTSYNKEIAETMPAIHYEFSTGYNIDLTSDRFLIPEALFDTTCIKNYYSSQMGMSQIIASAVGLCDVDIRQSLYGSVIVTGGNSLLNGFTERLNRDLVTKTPPSMRYKLITPNSSNERRYGAFIGGSILASLGTFQQMWISKQEYEEEGKGQVDRKCP